MMKRNKNLETLSWEHHDGLVLAFRLEKGIKNQIADNTISEYLLHAWDHVLQHHFWQEEEILTKPLDQSKDGREVLQKMLQEHEAIRKIISDIRRDKGDLHPLIRQFTKMLPRHIRFEERKLFPVIEHVISQEDLRKIGIFLHGHHKKDSKQWQVPFWR
jgi:hemerythrin-like domain-containing protein